MAYFVICTNWITLNITICEANKCEELSFHQFPLFVW